LLLLLHYEATIQRVDSIHSSRINLVRGFLAVAIVEGHFRPEGAQALARTVVNRNKCVHVILPLLMLASNVQDEDSSTNTLLNAVSKRVTKRAPQLSALAVYLIFVPFLLALSAAAGLTVWSNTARGWRSPIYLQYGDDRSPYADVQVSSLVSQQPYDVALHLTVPYSESNIALGNFMATLDVRTMSNGTVVTSRRSGIITNSRTGLLSFLPFKPEFATISIPFLAAQQFGVSKAVMSIELGRRDRWMSLGNGQGRELSVKNAELRGIIHHTGIRGLGTRFPVFFGIAASYIFFVISSLILASCLFPVFRLQATPVIESQPGEKTFLSEKQPPADLSPPPSYKPDSDSEKDYGRPKRRRSRTHLKEESDDDDQPSTSLRRRRSRPKSLLPSNE
jgi:hypothetical protein